MTFVKTRLLIERMLPGATAEILLKGAEPLGNVPDSVSDLGHEILSLERLEPGAAAERAADSPDQIYRLTVRKAG